VLPVCWDRGDRHDRGSGWITAQGPIEGSIREFQHPTIGPNDDIPVSVVHHPHYWTVQGEMSQRSTERRTTEPEHPTISSQHPIPTAVRIGNSGDDRRVQRLPN